jgi:hypothetical protein
LVYVDDILIPGMISLPLTTLRPCSLITFTSRILAN